MPSVIRCTCSHCGHESYHASSSGTLGKKVVKLSNARCASCGRIGVLITLNVQPPPNVRVLREALTTRARFTPLQ